MSTKSAFEPGHELFVRTPLLPFDAFTRWSSDLRAVGATGDRTEAIAADHEQLVARLRAMCLDPVIREAIFVASPSLHTAVDAWLADPAQPRAKGVPAILARYFTRMTSRATPFGLFSSCAVGQLDGDGAVVLGDRAGCRRHVRLDMLYLTTLAAALEAAPHIRAKVRFQVNGAVAVRPDGIVFPEAHASQVARTFDLVSVEPNEYILRVLAQASGWRTREELAATLVGDDITREEALDFVDELVASQLLVSELEPTVSGPEGLAHLLTVLRACVPDAAELVRLENVARAIDGLQREAIGLGIDAYEAVGQRCEGLPVVPDRARTFQVDLYRPLVASGVPRVVLDDLAAAIATLERIGGRTDQSALAVFRAGFEQRYGDREVPLLDALDEERGLSFPSARMQSRDPAPLIDGLALGGPRGTPPPQSSLDATLLLNLVRLWQSGAREWVLSEGDIEAMAHAPTLPVSDALTVMFRILARSVDAVQTGDYLVALDTAWGPSGAGMLGRFCHGDAAIHAAVKRVLAREEAMDPDAIHAEVIHLPEGRLGNILSRPPLRSFEIPYLGGSAAPADHRIEPSDLRVRVEGGRFVLRSARLDRRVRPHLTTAQNHAGSDLGVYRFLCAVQDEGTVDPVFNWGSFSDAPFLPRVRIGRVVVMPATWTLMAGQLHALGKGKTMVERFEAVQALRGELALPRLIGVAEGDHVLLVDLDNVVSVESFVAIAKERLTLKVTESSAAEGASVVRGPDGGYVHQLIVPFLRRTERRVRTQAPRRAPPTTEPPRSLMPGSEWLTVKAYGGTADADRVLLRAIAPLLAEARHDGMIDHWFFLRYADPGPHLRLRFHGSAEAMAAVMLPRVMRALAPMVEWGLVHNVQLDTYEREMERYGGAEGILLGERVFDADSDAVLAALEAIGSDPSDLRWQAVLVGMHRLLCDFGCTAQGRLEVVRRLRSDFGAEHAVDLRTTQALGDRFRIHRQAIDRRIDEGGSGFEPITAAFDGRTRALEPVVERLHALDRDGSLTTPLAGAGGVLASYLHMHATRMLRSQNRQQELVLYDFLTRRYESDLARGRMT